MKRRSPYLMITTLFCVLFFSSCQKDDIISSSQNLRGNGYDPFDPINGILVPLAGNGYITKPASGGTETIASTGLTNWTNTKAITSTFFYVANPGELAVAIKASVPSGTSTVKVFLNGKAYTITDINGNASKNYRIGIMNIAQAGYVKLDLQGISNTNNSVFANVSDVVLYSSPTISATSLSFANNPATYNISRKGAEVRLQYTIPNGITPEWFYNEMIVPVSSDRLGTNFTSNGFDGGNSGVQITASGEKRMTFFVLNTPTGNAKIINTGAGVTEEVSGAGKLLYLAYNWTAGTPYKFLTRAMPDGLGGMSYSTWFYSSEESQWKFIATCSRPNVSNYLTGLYSSLQCVNTNNTYLSRRMSCINQWMYANGTWSEVTSATFKGDDIATNKQRLDYSASTDYYAFSLKNAGFVYDNNLALNSSLTRQATATAPTVDLNNLPQ